MCGLLLKISFDIYACQVMRVMLARNMISSDCMLFAAAGWVMFTCLGLARNRDSRLFVNANVCSLLLHGGSKHDFVLQQQQQLDWQSVYNDNCNTLQSFQRDNSCDTTQFSD